MSFLREHGETLVVVALVFGGLVGAAIVVWQMMGPAWLVAGYFALGVVAALYRFLGGIDPDTSMTVGALKVTGTAAVFVGIVLFGNDFLEEQLRELRERHHVVPEASQWVALDRASGTPVDLTIHGDTLRMVEEPGSATHLLRASLRADVEGGRLLVRPRDESGASIATLEPRSLQRLGVFNGFDAPGDFIFTDELGVGDEEELRIYPFTVRMIHFGQNRNEFQLVSAAAGEVVDQPSLMSKQGRIVDHDGRHYLVFVVRANHMLETNKHAVVGMTALSPEFAVRGTDTAQ